MKHFLLLPLLAIATNSLAETFPITQVNTFYEYHLSGIIPAQFTYDKHDQLIYINNYDILSEEPMNVTIFNADGSLFKELTIPIQQTIVSTETVTSDHYNDDIPPSSYTIEHRITAKPNTITGFTQTFFNNDNLYEYVIPTYELCKFTRKYDDNSYSEKRIGTEIVCTGFKVKSEDGRDVASIDIPEEFRPNIGKYANIYALNLENGKYSYLIINVYPIVDINAFFPESNLVNLLYRIDRETSSIQRIGVTRGTKVFPTTPQLGTAVNVEFEPSSEPSEVIVTSVNGSVVEKQNIAPGNGNTTIDTSRFERGLYIVTVKNGNQTTENTKIIIR